MSEQTYKIGYYLQQQEDSNNAAFENAKKMILQGYVLKDRFIADMVKERDYLGETLLHHAVKYGRIDAIKQLIHLGADVRAQNNFGIEPINRCFSPEIVTILLNHGADINSTDDEGETILTHAYFMEKPDLVAFLLENNADSKVLKKRFDLPRNWTNEQIVQDLINDTPNYRPGGGPAEQCVLS